jgi:hypothetical protein
MESSERSTSLDGRKRYFFGQVACSGFPVADAASLRGGEADFDQKVVPNSLLANEPSLSTQGTGGNCGS